MKCRYKNLTSKLTIWNLLPSLLKLVFIVSFLLFLSYFCHFIGFSSRCLSENIIYLLTDSIWWTQILHKLEPNRYISCALKNPWDSWGKESNHEKQTCKLCPKHRLSLGSSNDSTYLIFSLSPKIRISFLNNFVKI